MNTKQKEEFSHRAAYAANENINILAGSGWAYARIILFSTRHYGLRQQKKIVKYIYSFLARAYDPYEAYMEFCIRIMLAAEYARKYNNGHLPYSAILWFDPSYTEGFQRTGLLYKQFCEKFPCNTVTTKHWKALAEAILDILEENSVTNFEYWVNWFRQRRAGIYLHYYLQAHTYNNFKNLFYV